VQLPASAAGGSKASGWAELPIAKTAAEEAALRRNPLRPQPGNFTEETAKMKALSARLANRGLHLTLGCAACRNAKP